MKKSQFKIGVVLAYVLIFVNLLYGFFVSPFLIQKLTSANYGAYKTISSLIGTVSVLDFGISSTVIRYLSKFFSEKDEGSTRSFLGMVFYQAILIVLVIVGVGVVLYFSLDGLYGASDLGTNIDPGLVISKRLFVLLLINTVIGVPCSIFNAIIVAHKDFFFANLSRIVRLLFQFGSLILVVPLPFWNGSTLSVGVVLIATSVLFLLIDFLYVVFRIKIRPAFRIKFIPKWIIKESLVFTLLSFIQTTLIQFEGNIDNILIGKFISSEAVTTYSLAILFYSVFNQLSTGISNLLLPSVSQKIADGATDQDLENLTIRVGRIQFMILGGALFGFIACGQMFISVWVGESQLLVWVLGSILMAATLLPLIENVALAVIRAKNKILFRTIAVFVGTIFNFLITWVSVSFLNIPNDIKLVFACLGTATSLIGANVIAMNIYYKKTLGFHPLRIFKSIFHKTLICLIPPFVITFFFAKLVDYSWGSFVFSVLLFVCIYGALLYFFGMNEEEKNVLLGRFLVFSDHKRVVVGNGKELMLFPDDLFFDLPEEKKIDMIASSVGGFSKTPSYRKSNLGNEIYDDGEVLIVDESEKDKYSFVDYFRLGGYKTVIIICHRAFFAGYRKDYKAYSALATPVFKKEDRVVLKPKKRMPQIGLSKREIAKNVLISLGLVTMSFGLSYVFVDHSPENVSTYLINNYSGISFCKITPSSYPANPFITETFAANQAATPSMEYFYCRDYLLDNNALYIFEPKEGFSPFQYRRGGEYVDATFVSSNYVDLSDPDSFSKMGLDLISSTNSSKEKENLIAISRELAIDLFGSVADAIGNSLDFYLYSFQMIRTGREFTIVGVFDYSDAPSYYSLNKPTNLFVTNPKTVSMGWSGFEYLVSLPTEANSLCNSMTKIFQIESAYHYSYSLYALGNENNGVSVLDITEGANRTIKRVDSLERILMMSIVSAGYLCCLFLFVKENFNIRKAYFLTSGKRRINKIAISASLCGSLVIDLVLLHLLKIVFVWKIILLPLIGCLVLSLIVPILICKIAGTFRK